MTEECLANSMMLFRIPRTSLFTHPSINQSTIHLFGLSSAPLNHKRRNKYKRPSLFAGSYLALSQIRWSTPRIQIHHSNPSVDRGNQTVRKLKQARQPYRVMFHKLKEKSSGHHHYPSARKH